MLKEHYLAGGRAERSDDSLDADETWPRGDGTGKDSDLLGADGPFPVGPRRAGPFRVGESLGPQYQVCELIGRGGHAFVYDCYDSFLSQHVAVKVIPDPPRCGRDRTRRARIEANVLSRLDHPNIVRVSTAGRLNAAMVYIVMERLYGTSLRPVLDQLGSLSTIEALTVGLQVAEGVAAAHDLQVIHRDLKPENVYLQSRNRVKVLDFGLVKLIDERARTTHQELSQGTVLYMSPEHIQGEGVTVRSDVYALGIMLYEMLAGTHPCLVGVRDPSLETLGWLQVTRVPPRLTELVPALPPEVAELVARATAKRPAERFATMQQFARRIRAALARCRASGHSTEPPERDLVLAWRHGLGSRGVPVARASTPAEALIRSSPAGARPDTPSPRPDNEVLSPQAFRDRGPEVPGSRVKGLARALRWFCRVAGSVSRPNAERSHPASTLLGAVTLGVVTAVPVGMLLGERPQRVAHALGAAPDFGAWWGSLVARPPTAPAQGQPPLVTKSAPAATSVSAFRNAPPPSANASSALPHPSPAEPEQTASSNQQLAPEPATTAGLRVASRVPTGATASARMPVALPSSKAQRIAGPWAAGERAPGASARTAGTRSNRSHARTTAAELLHERTHLFELETRQAEAARTSGPTRSGSTEALEVSPWSRRAETPAQ